MLIALMLASAELIVHHGVVRTMDARDTVAQAVVCEKGRIVAVGTNEEVLKLRGPSTRVIDAGGRLVLPGFNDAHVHFLSGGFQLSSVDLRDAATPEEFARRIAAFAARQPAGRWIQGGDWDHELWAGAPLPARSMIDSATPRHPVFVNRLDGHMALANSVALKLAGITRATKDPDGGLIVRDEAGEPTGVLKDAAMNLVYRVIPPASFEEKLASARAASRHAASVGVTSVQDVSAGLDLSVYRELRRRGELLTRIYGAAPLMEWEKASRGGDEWLRWGALKGFADGSLGSTTALFFDGYADAPGSRGLPSDEMFPEGAMLRRIQGADRAGLQLFIHAIGDRANATILNYYDEVARANGPRDRRWRIEHAQHLRPADIARFRALGVVASMQPYHAADDGRWAEKRIGAERAQYTYAFRSLLDAGATLAFGSDWTVAPLNPLLGIDAAVTRRTIDGKNPGGWVPRQKITVKEAVRAYTQGSAYAEFQEKEKGSIEKGKLADLVMLSEDIYASREIGRARVVKTIAGGRVVYEE